MEETAFWSGSPQALVVAIVLLGLVVLAAVKLLWGMALWTKKSDHRVGDRWGGEHVEVVEWTGAEGYVRAGGELWRAHSKDQVAAGDAVRVLRMDGLILEVRAQRKGE